MKEFCSYRELVDSGSGANSAGVIALIRHSEREAILSPDVNASFTAPLTQHGKDLALAYGLSMSTPTQIKIYYSPSPRCEETAHVIADGIKQVQGSVEIVGKRRYLATPYLIEPQRAIEQFVKLGGCNFMTSWLDGSLDEKIIEPFQLAANNLLKDLFEEKENQGSDLFHLHVTHDMTIMTLLGLAFDVSDRELHWPTYLEGMSIYSSPAVLFQYKGIKKALQ
jgi:hypothetical protein